MSAPTAPDSPSGGNGSSETAADGLPEGLACPFCDGTDTQPLAQFGSLLMTAHYYCRSCRSTFDWARVED